MNNYTPKEQLFTQVDRQRELGIPAPGMDYLVLAVAELRDAVRDVGRQLYQANKDREERHQETRARQDAFLSLAREWGRKLAGELDLGEDAQAQELMEQLARREDPWAREPQDAREAEDDLERARRIPESGIPGGRTLHALRGGPDGRSEALKQAVMFRSAAQGLLDFIEEVPVDNQDDFADLVEPVTTQLMRWVGELEARAGVQQSARAES